MHTAPQHFTTTIPADALPPAHKVDPVVHKVVRRVATFSGVSHRALFNPTRCISRVAEARQLAMYILHVTLGMTLSDIGRQFGRNRTTASHACHCVEDRRDDAAFDNAITALEDEFGAMSFAPSEQTVADHVSF